MDPVSAALLDPDTTVAVVGANDDPGKYGSVIYRDLKLKGFKVFAVNPKRGTVDGDPAYDTLADLPEKATIVNFVVPPPVSLKVLAEAKELGYDLVWMQPGSSSPEVRDYITTSGFDYLIDACIMVRAHHRV
ncbi:MAG: CoA-binding protein [bacterium]|nr:CoA-binding protein [bacterium]